MTSPQTCLVILLPDDPGGSTTPASMLLTPRARSAERCAALHSDID